MGLGRVGWFLVCRRKRRHLVAFLEQLANGCAVGLGESLLIEPELELRRIEVAPSLQGALNPLPVRVVLAGHGRSITTGRPTEQPTGRWPTAGGRSAGIDGEKRMAEPTAAKSGGEGLYPLNIPGSTGGRLPRRGRFNRVVAAFCRTVGTEAWTSRVSTQANCGQGSAPRL